MYLHKFQRQNKIYSYLSATKMGKKICPVFDVNYNPFSQFNAQVSTGENEFFFCFYFAFCCGDFLWKKKSFTYIVVNSSCNWKKQVTPDFTLTFFFLFLLAGIFFSKLPWNYFSHSFFSHTSFSTWRQWALKFFRFYASFLSFQSFFSFWTSLLLLCANVLCHFFLENS